MAQISSPSNRLAFLRKRQEPVEVRDPFGRIVFGRRTLLAAILLLGSHLSAGANEKVIGPVRGKFQEVRSDLLEPLLPVEPGRRVSFQSKGGLSLEVMSDNKKLHLDAILTALKIDDQVQNQGPWRAEAHNIRLPKTASGKERDGFYSVYTAGKIRITQSVEAVPGTKPGERKRQLDTVLVRYTIENKDNISHKRRHAQDHGRVHCR